MHSRKLHGGKSYSDIQPLHLDPSIQLAPLVERAFEHENDDDDEGQERCKIPTPTPPTTHGKRKSHQMQTYFLKSTG
ncbi:hypothetical protein K435DRAFT_853476 [Dendrothele bispora CBS 962.96]|uniref:Uncharacterized protein n=1 Tax=Dendrothele bispora (strain CBS 962.96) TaxID=1314807 RepID=A0A4S8MHJ8_DENBC|nr:hypothetical protein K435DRAFT_853476 [Dendrothele bispora CBS 962.96]